MCCGQKVVEKWWYRWSGKVVEIVLGIIIVVEPVGPSIVGVAFSPSWNPKYLGTMKQ